MNQQNLLYLLNLFPVTLYWKFRYPVYNYRRQNQVLFVSKNLFAVQWMLYKKKKEKKMKKENRWLNSFSLSCKNKAVETDCTKKFQLKFWNAYFGTICLGLRSVLTFVSTSLFHWSFLMISH